MYASYGVAVQPVQLESAADIGREELSYPLQPELREPRNLREAVAADDAKAQAAADAEAAKKLTQRDKARGAVNRVTGMPLAGPPPEIGGLIKVHSPYDVAAAIHAKLPNPRPNWAYDQDTTSMLPFYAPLVAQKKSILVFSGDVDVQTVPFAYTMGPARARARASLVAC